MRWGTLGSGSIGVLYEGHHGGLRVDHQGAFARRTPRFTIGIFRPLGIWIRRLVTLLLLGIALSCPLMYGIRRACALRPPPLGRVPRPPGAAQTPNFGDFRPAQKSKQIKNVAERWQDGALSTGTRYVGPALLQHLARAGGIGPRPRDPRDCSRSGLVRSRFSLAVSWLHQTL